MARQTAMSVHHLASSWPVRYARLVRDGCRRSPRCSEAVDQARASLRHPRRRRLELVRRPLPDHLVLSGYTGPLPGPRRQVVRARVASALLFFLSVLLHEFGHAFVAVRNGIGISGIDLWFLGGVAKMERDTDSPGVEFRVAVAGPLVTLAIVLVCFGLGSRDLGRGRPSPGRRFETRSRARPTRCSATCLDQRGVLLFNLIPASRSTAGESSARSPGGGPATAPGPRASRRGSAGASRSC